MFLQLLKQLAQSLRGSTGRTLFPCCWSFADYCGIVCVQLDLCKVMVQARLKQGRWLLVDVGRLKGELSNEKANKNQNKRAKQPNLSTSKTVDFNVMDS